MLRDSPSANASKANAGVLWLKTSKGNHGAAVCERGTVSYDFFENQFDSDESTLTRAFRIIGAQRDSRQKVEITLWAATIGEANLQAKGLGINVRSIEEVAEGVDTVEDPETVRKEASAPPPIPDVHLGDDLVKLGPVLDPIPPTSPSKIPACSVGAGIVWILVGGVAAAFYGYVLIRILGISGIWQLEATLLAKAFIPSALLISFSLLFVQWGFQTLRGTAESIATKGVGSLLIAAFLCWYVLQQQRSIDPKAETLTLVLIFSGPFCLAGLLAIGSNEDYQEWRRVTGRGGGRTSPRAGAS